MVQEKGLSAQWFRRLVYIPVFIGAFIMLMPYLWMVLGAFKPVAELSKTPPTFTIDKPTLNNFYNAGYTPGVKEQENIEGLLQRFQDVPGGFWRFYFNSLFVTTTVTICVLVLASLAAFVLAKHHFPGRQFFFLMFIASMMVPWQVMLIPGFLIMKQFGWIDTYTALIVPALPKAFVVFFLRQYMLALPDDLLDAARIDGAGEFRIWWQVVLPLVRPALVAMGIFILLGEWNNFVWPLVIVQSSALRTLPLALALLNSAFNGANTIGILMAGALLISLPTLLLFMIFQKQFIRGIALTGVKG